MATMSLILNLLGLTTCIAGGLTILEIAPAFINSGAYSNPALETAFFWWAVSVVLLLSAIAFGVYRNDSRTVVYYDKQQSTEDQSHSQG